MLVLVNMTSKFAPPVRPGLVLHSSWLMICVRALFAQVGLLLDEQDSAKRLATSRPRKPADAKEGERRNFIAFFWRLGLYVVTLEV